MNSENIHQLITSLVNAGFDPSIGYRLLRQICFHPAQFLLMEQVEQEKDVINCSLYFERTGDIYHCVYYDAALLKFIDLTRIEVEGIRLSELEQQLSAIRWDESKETASRFKLSDATTWANEQQIAAALTQLNRLSLTEEGKHYSDYLQSRFCHFPIAASLASSRHKISQRFYFFEGEGISTGEAYRFLVNQWLERNLKERRKQPATTSEEKNEPVKANLKKRGRRPQKNKL